MLRAITALIGYKIKATDGDIGKVDQFLFDDARWAVRYLVVETGHWLTKRKVLLSPIAIQRADWITQHIHVSLSRAQVENSPDLDTDMPVSRQREIEIFDYYKWPYYWLGEGLWGPKPMPEGPTQTTRVAEPTQRDEAGRAHDEHLRSSDEVIGYHIRALDREFGHVEDFIIDDENWSIRYMVVATKNFWPGGRTVLLAPQWIREISWEERRVHVDLESESIKNGPEFDPYAPVNREYEVRLYDYYGRPKYWETELEHEHESQNGNAQQGGNNLHPAPKST